MSTMLRSFFENRTQAGRLLAEQFVGMPLERPLVLAIARGGIDVGVEIARRLGAELDVVLARKLRCPFQPELALGAVSETGEVTFDRFSSALALVVVLSAASNALVLDEAPNPVSGAVAAPDDPDVVKSARDTVERMPLSSWGGCVGSY